MRYLIEGASYFKLSCLPERRNMAEPFRFANGQLAYTVEDLLKISEQSPQDSINYLVQGDFENWLDYIGETKVAQQAREARQANLNEQERLQKFLKSSKTSSSVSRDVKPGSVQEALNKASENSSKGNNPVAKFFSKLFGG